MSIRTLAPLNSRRSNFAQARWNPKAYIEAASRSEPDILMSLYVYNQYALHWKTRRHAVCSSNFPVHLISALQRTLFHSLQIIHTSLIIPPQTQPVRPAIIVNAPPKPPVHTCIVPIKSAIFFPRNLMSYNITPVPDKKIHYRYIREFLPCSR